MKLLLTALAFTAAVSAQEAPANPLIATSRTVFTISRTDVLRSVDKVPDDMWSWRPTDSVRTFGQLFAHIADGQYEFCGVAAGETISKNVEKSMKTKAEIVPALKDAFAYCDNVYAKLTDADAPALATFFGRKITKLGAMDFNTAHNMEHYGNLVTYMRLKNIVPPSSEAPPPAAKKQ